MVLMSRMSMFSGRLVLAFVLAALCLGGRTAHAQTSPLTYWTPGWPFGFSGTESTGQAANTYGNFPGFDFREAGNGFGYARYNFSNGWFVGSERGPGWNSNGVNQIGAFNSLSYEGVQFGYNFQKSGGLPLSVYAGFDTLKYNTGIGSAFSPLDSTGGTVPGYSARAGLEYQPTSNVSLSLGFGFTQQSGAGRVDSDINASALPGATPFAFSSGHR
jgi:opacity protein-like surface antigen